MLVHGLVLGGIVLTSLASPGAACARELIIHLRKDGNDSSDGLSEPTAVASLQVAVDRALGQGWKGHSELQIRIHPGIYIGQRALISKTPKNVHLRILSAGKSRPRFDGSGTGSTWFTLNSNGYSAPRIEISGFEIVNYITAISLNGDRNNSSLSNGRHVIHNNIFSNIGQIAHTDSEPSTAAIRLLNSDYNSIKFNEFINIKNKQSCELIHGIYLAHGSTNNEIVDNNFRDICGDSIRFRDASNYNFVSRNVFYDAWSLNPVSEWFCDKTINTKCTKNGFECPSFNNVLEANRIVSHDLRKPNLFRTYIESSPPACKVETIETRAILR